MEHFLGQTLLFTVLSYVLSVLGGISARQQPWEHHLYSQPSCGGLLRGGGGRYLSISKFEDRDAGHQDAAEKV